MGAAKLVTPADQERETWSEKVERIIACDPNVVDFSGTSSEPRRDAILALLAAAHEAGQKALAEQVREKCSDCRGTAYIGQHACQKCYWVDKVLYGDAPVEDEQEAGRG